MTKKARSAGLVGRKIGDRRAGDRVENPRGSAGSVADHDATVRSFQQTAVTERGQPTQIGDRHAMNTYDSL